MERQESDQLPEEAPAEQVPDDDRDGRDEAKQNEGPGDADRATGHPDESEQA